MHRDGRDARLALIAARQAGAFSFAQALAAGFPRATISRRLASGTWTRGLPGVLVIAGTPPARSLALWIAVLAVGHDAVLTHETGALLHGAERLPLMPITLIVPHGGHHRVPGTFAHQIDDLAASHRTTHDGLPVSTPARTVVDLAATRDVATIGRVADDLVRSRRTSYAAIAGVLAQIARPGKPGLDKIVSVLDERGDGHVPPASELERALFDALAAGGLPPPQRQVPLPGRGIDGVVDAAYLDAQIVLEADGRRWHTRMEASRQDRERDARVVRSGWVPLRFVHEQVVHDPAEVCATVRETIQQRLVQLGRAA